MGTPISFRGIFPPIPTAFDADGSVALDAMVENLEKWNTYGLGGYVVAGSNGEAVYLTAEEKRCIWELARQFIPDDKLMIAGTGCESTAQTIALTQVAAEAGSDAALVVTPHYYDGLMTHEGLVRHFQAVADASPIPVLMYNVPKFTHVDLAPETAACAAEHPNIVGMKDSSGNVAKIASIVRLTGADFQVLVGAGGVLFPALVMGAVGGVVALGNVAPKQAVDILELHGDGRWDEAAELQRQMQPVNAAVTSRFGIPGLKAGLEMLGYYGGPVRPPLVAANESTRQEIRAVLESGGLL